ncbi:restriction endonuclease subunit S [Geofilum rhodophaeum]|uniref:restriction endonuclease subunit S n=1 Tax=Geofilum rhodophaeum TaxID=1965019 RepID=UPI000B520103|nr:restriction endonuclease subunit S [Geofilum rhodophaeum]
MSNKKKLIPALRFPEFKEDGEWEEKKLGEVFEIGSGRDYKHLEPGNIPVYGSGGYMLSVDNYLYDGESVCIGRKGTIDKPMFLSGKFWTVDTLFYTHSFKGSWPKLIFYIFQKINWINHNEAGGIPSLSKTLINKIGVMLPSLPEQQKIADCLSSLDDLLAAHNEKLELLKGHKKGLMQNLFPQEGERVPKFRFPEFENDGEWEEITLGNICNLVRGPFGGALKKETFVKEGYAVYEQSHAIHNEFNSFRYYIDIENFSKLKRFSVKPGDLIMSCSGTMGRFAIIQQDFKMGIINQALLKLTVKDHNSNIFVKFLMETENNQSKLLSQSAGGAIKNVVSVSQIKELSLLIPSIPEQKKIASCLSAVDDLIKAETEKIEALKEHKKGLMQGLFPKMEY